LGTALPKAFASKIESEAQHIKELDTVLKDRLRIVFYEKVPVNICDPESLPLVESELVAECSGAHLQSAGAGPPVEIDDPLQKRRADTGFLVVRMYCNAHKLLPAGIKGLNGACGDNYSVVCRDETP